VVIDVDRSVCERLAADVGAQVVCGGATSVETLEHAGMDRADIAVATMRSDADNLAFAILAKSLGAPRVIARMRNPRYESAYREAGVSATSHIVDVFVNQLLLEIDEPHLRQIAAFGAGKAAIVVDSIPESAMVDGMSVSQIAADEAFSEECVITGIYRSEGEVFLIPRGSAVVRAGDRVFLVANRPNLKKASRFLHRKK
jgi:trk system potassium uptake protein TrkA